MWEYAMGYAQQALQLESRPTDSRAAALEVAGRYFYRAGLYRQAAAVFGELTQLRRHKFDWATLGISLAELGDLRGSEAALRESIRINGGDPDLYETLGIVVGRSNPEEGRELDAVARRLRAALSENTEIR
jgi:Flp pilus assembly protein TadD